MFLQIRSNISLSSCRRAKFHSSILYEIQTVGVEQDVPTPEYTHSTSLTMEPKHSLQCTNVITHQPKPSKGEAVTQFKSHFWSRQIFGCEGGLIDIDFAYSE